MRASAISITVALDCVLAAALVYLWHDPARFHWSEPAPLKPALGRIEVAASAPLGDVSRFRETLERPVFSPTRRPGPKVDPSAPEAPRVDPLKDVQLLGMYGSGARGGALVVVKGKVQRVPYGGKIGDWTVAGGEGRAASLVDSRGERRELKMAMITDAPATPVSNERPAASAAAPSAPPSAPAAAPAAARRGAAQALSEEEIKERRRKAIEHMNAGRVKRGFPPVKVD